MNFRLANYTTEIASSIKEVDWDEWDQTVADAGGSVFHTSRWLRAFEEASSAEVIPYHVIVRLNGEVVGLSPAYVTGYCPRLELYRNNLLADYGRFEQKMLISHTLYGQYSQVLVRRAPYKDVYDLIIKAIHDGCKQREVPFYGFPMVHGQDPLLEFLREKGFVVRYMNSVNKLWLTEGDLDCYLARFPSRKKRNLQMILRKATDLGLVVIRQLGETEMKDLIELSLRTCSHHGSPKFFSEEFLDKTLQYLGDDVVAVFVKTPDGKTIAGSMGLKYRDTLTPWVIGLDYSELKRCDQYNLLYLAWINLAIDNGLRLVEFGRGTFYIKAKFGVIREPIYICMQAVDPGDISRIGDWCETIEKNSMVHLAKFEDDYRILDHEH